MIGLVLATLLSVHSCQTLVVTKANVKYKHYTTIQSAVDAAKPCDWVVVAPGVYREKVVIRIGNLHVRGLNRNMVIVDGAHRVGNGIEVQRSSNVWIENLTVRNFDRATRDGAAATHPSRRIDADGFQEVEILQVHPERGALLADRFVRPDGVLLPASFALDAHLGVQDHVEVVAFVPNPLNGVVHAARSRDRLVDRLAEILQHLTKVIVQFHAAAIIASAFGERQGRSGRRCWYTELSLFGKALPGSRVVSFQFSVFSLESGTDH